jgi:hypothetical protein
MEKLSLDFDLDPLVLPTRFETLENEVEELGLSISSIVVKVEEANQEIEKLLNLIGKIGKFKIFHGPSGKGKTTFLKTLSEFFQNIEVVSISRQTLLKDIPEFIANEKPIHNQGIFIIEDRDNPNESTEDLRDFFEELRFRFRKEFKDILIIWPITDKDLANEIGDIAWNVGRDSITSSSGAIYEFSGVSKDKYYEIANTTSINLNNGRTLESYGITKDSISLNLNQIETIGQFFTHVSDISLENNENIESKLKNKTIPKVWVLLPGDQATEIDRTVKGFTQGIQYKMDIERFLSELDNPDNKNQYLIDWKKIREKAAYLIQILDIRLFPVSPSLALSSVRAFGCDSSKEDLIKKNETETKAIQDVKKSALYKMLIDDIYNSQTSPSPTKEDTRQEYIRLQNKSNKKDTLYNKALATAIKKALVSDGFEVEIFTEKQNLPNSALQPDIQIKINQNHIVCLEPTWRTTGKGITGEIIDSSNSLGLGSIQQYVLNKVMDYIKSLNL